MMVVQIPTPCTGTTTVHSSSPVSPTDVVQPAGTLNSPLIHEQVKLIIIVPLATIIILCNLVVLGFLIFNRKLHKPSYLFIGCMSFADFAVGCVSIWTMKFEGDRAFIPCLLRMSLLTSAVVASLFCMGWVAVDRYFAIRKPFTYNQKMTKWRAVLAMAVLWVIALCIGFAPLMGWEVKHSTEFCSFCYIDTIEYEAFLFVVGFGMPMATTIVVYILLFKNARVHIKRMEVVEHVASGAAKDPALSRNRCFWKSRRWRSSRTLVLMISCFLFTWCPFVVGSVVQMICDDACQQLKSIVSTYLLLLGFCNSFMNPVIYAASNKEFKSVVINTWEALRSKISRRSQTT